MSVIALGPEHRDEVLRLDQAAFVFPLDPGYDTDFLEWDRTFGVRDGDELIGVNTTFSLRLTVPDGADGAGTRSVPMAGLSWVAVSPGYRRRGVLSAMMRHHLHRLHEQELESISGLHASEPAIYGRFGYGLATTGHRLTLGRGVDLRDVPGSPDLRVRFVAADVEQHADLVSELYSVACARRPGMVDRSLALTAAELRQTPRELEREEPLRLVVVERDGSPTGYALVRRQMVWKDGEPDGTTHVAELAAVDLASEHRLWRTVTDFDLSSRTKASRVGAHDPLMAWLVDHRAAQPTLTDELWLRIVDVDRALSERTYAVDVDVVLAVTDELCPWNARRWRLSGGPAAATCTPTTDPADVALDVRELGSVFAGGVTVAELARAQLATEHRPGTVARLSTAFRSAVQPTTTYCF